MAETIALVAQLEAAISGLPSISEVVLHSLIAQSVNVIKRQADEIERLTECRRADAEHLALEVSEREARGREIERLRAALTTIAAYRGRVDVAHHLAGIAEGALEYESEPPAQYPDPSPIDVEPT
jgi:NAD(P)-dependent dehydrogenase (short-subunit alcohol dehydrogenase family)